MQIVTPGLNQGLQHTPLSAISAEETITEEKQDENQEKDKSKIVIVVSTHCAPSFHLLSHNMVRLEGMLLMYRENSSKTRKILKSSRIPGAITLTLWHFTGTVVVYYM